MTDNPFAFPRPGFTGPAGCEEGMTLRDWFAGQLIIGNPLASHPHDQARVARLAYQQADALLAERERRP